MKKDAMLVSLLVVIEQPNHYYLKVLISFASLGFRGIIQKEIVGVVIVC
jgi:hypothetical protein